MTMHINTSQSVLLTAATMFMTITSCISVKLQLCKLATSQGLCAVFPFDRFTDAKEFTPLRIRIRWRFQRKCLKHDARPQSNANNEQKRTWCITALAVLATLYLHCITLQGVHKSTKDSDNLSGNRCFWISLIHKTLVAKYKQENKNK